MRISLRELRMTFPLFACAYSHILQACRAAPERTSVYTYASRHLPLEFTYIYKTGRCSGRFGELGPRPGSKVSSP